MWNWYSIALVVVGVILWDVDDQMQLENGADVVSSIRYKKRDKRGTLNFDLSVPFVQSIYVL